MSAWLFGVLVTFGGHSAASEASAGEITVQVGQFRNGRGYLGCRLFNTANSFPEGKGIAAVRGDIKSGHATCTFENVEPGRYAIAVLHDENANGRMDKTLIGKPKEGYGVSRNRTYAMSPPKWSESSFELTSGQARTFRIRLRY